MNKQWFFLGFLTLLFYAVTAVAYPKADKVVIVKSQKHLYLMSQGEIFKRYTIALGPIPRGHKTRAGDERTPEGHYYLDFKKADSNYYKAIHISYPNDEDIERAKSLGVNPGGQIMIHGLPNKVSMPESLVQLYNWTDGCIAVTNQEMDEIWNAVDEGTPIEILP